MEEQPHRCKRCSRPRDEGRDPSGEPTADGGVAGARWYWASATYKAVHLGMPRKRHLWERSVFLVGAADEAEARAEAERLAREKEHQYGNLCAETVRWVLQEVEDVQELIDTPGEQGAEVYWQFFERVDKEPNAVGLEERT